MEKATKLSTIGLGLSLGLAMIFGAVLAIIDPFNSMK